MKKLLLLVFFALLAVWPAHSQTVQDSARKASELLQDASVTTSKKEVNVTIRNVDITQFPIVKIIIEAYNIYGEPLDTLPPNALNVMENGKEKKIISVEKITVKERVPVDFVFVIDRTGSMQPFIDQVKQNLSNFTNTLVKRGIDYRLGLVLFADGVEKIYEPTSDVWTFTGWLSKVRAFGGGDVKENALEGISEAMKTKFRPSANKIIVLLTDAPYHQAGEKGEGTTSFTTESIIKELNKNEARLFAIAPPRLENYNIIAKSTRGNCFDIGYPYSTVLDIFSNQLTNLFALKYRTNEPAIPDSIQIALLNQRKQELVRKIIPIVELGRKLIIESLLYKTAESELDGDVSELDVMYEFMKNKPSVTILVEGHTDNIGSNKTNDALSLARAEGVKKYLVAKGIEPRRIKTKGYGKRKPIVDNDTEEHRRLNRRTEIVIIKK